MDFFAKNDNNIHQHIHILLTIPPFHPQHLYPTFYPYHCHTPSWHLVLLLLPVLQLPTPSANRHKALTPASMELNAIAVVADAVTITPVTSANTA